MTETDDIQSYISKNRLTDLVGTTDHRTLKFEHFLLPGTLMLADDRTANARILKLNLQRNCKYVHDTVGDIHTLELCEPALGPYNQRQINFCIGDDWSKQFG